MPYNNHGSVATQVKMMRYITNMDIILMLLAIFALGIVVRNIDGPFNLFQKARIKLLQNKYVGPFFYKLLECSICSGFWCGISIYMLMALQFSIREFALWGLVGSAVLFIG